MLAAQLNLNLDTPPPRKEAPPKPPSAGISGGEKAKARDILAAIRTLKTIEAENRLASPQERKTLSRFPGFGPVALTLFP